MHPDLLRQLKRIGLDDPATIPTAEQWAALLNQVSRDYEGFQRDRAVREQTLSVSAHPMEDVLAQLRAASESRMAAERDRLRSLVSAIGAGLCTLDRDGRIQSLNAEGQRLLLWTEDEVRGEPLRQRILGAPDGSAPAEALADALAGRRAARAVDGRLLRADGSTVPVSYGINPLFEDGVPVGAAFVFVDITPIVQTREALQSRDAILEAVSYAAGRFLREPPWERHAQDFLARLGQATGVSRVYLFENRQAMDDDIMVDQRFEWTAPGVSGFGSTLDGLALRSAGFGRWLDEFRLGRSVSGPVSSFLEEEQPLLLQSGIKSVLTVPIFAGNDWWGTIGFDERRRERDWPAGVVDALTAAAGVIGAAIRSERNAAELRARESQYRLVVDNVRDVIFQTDPQGRWSFLNPAWTAMTGFSVDESLSQPARSFLAVSAEDDGEAIRRVNRGEVGELSRVMRFRTRDGGSRVVDAYLRRVTFEDGSFAGLAGALHDITEQREAEDALRRSEQYFRSLTDNAMDLVIIVDPTGTIRFASNAARGILGFTPADLVGRNAARLIHPDDLVVTGELLADVTAGRSQIGRLAFRVRHQDGHYCMLEASATNLLDDETVRGIVVNARDISERVVAEQELRRRNEVLAALHESALDLINRRNLDDVLRAIVDRAGAPFATVDGFIHLVAPTHDHMSMRVGTGVFEPLQGRRIELHEGVAGRAWATAAPFVVNDYEHWDGALQHERRVEVFDSLVGMPLLSGNDVVGVLGLAQRPGKPPFTEADIEILSLFAQLASIVLDNVRLYAQAKEEIDEREQAAEALRRSEGQVRALLDAIPDLMLQISNDGVFLDYKPGRAEAQSAPREWVVGRSVWDVFPADRAAAFLQHVHRASATGGPQVLEFSFQAGGKTYDREARFVKSGDQEVVTLIRDITERKKVERLKNEFVSTVSHELRTPLTSIRGSLGLLNGGIGGEIPASARALVEIAFSNSERLVRLIGDILDVEKIESGKVEFERVPLNLMELVEAAVAANEGYAAEFGVSLALVERTDEAVVHGDHDRLMQVMANLLSNAAKFSPAGERVDVAVGRGDGMIRVTVTNRGPGIPTEFHDRVFQRFAQADTSDSRQKGGTGLGLSISKAIVDRLGGSIGFKSEPGETSFWFELTDAAASAREAAPPVGNVLVCEDDPDVAMVLRFLLQVAGFAVDAAHTAADARRLLQQRSYLAMTLDLMLPDADGIALIRELRADPKTADLPIVVVSVQAERGHDDLNGDAVEIFDWIGKPIDHERLVAAVRQAARRAERRMPRVLHVEDDPAVRALVRAVLEGTAETEDAGSVAEAADALADGGYDLVILDQELGDGKGIELLPQVAHASRLPVVLFTAHEIDPDTARQFAATLVKARTSNAQLLETIRGLIGKSVAESGNEDRSGGPAEG
ncbi:MAG: PAS domain S-box protein [Dehalococcoidia bacterium]